MRLVSIAFATSFVFALACGSTSGEVQHVDSLMSWAHYHSVAELVAVSDLIIRGSVARKLGERVITGGGRVPPAVTEFQVNVQKTLKGQAQPQLTVVQLGRAGDPANTYPEFPLLGLGSEVVLFLRSAASDQDAVLKFGIASPEGVYVVSGGRLQAGASESVLSSVLSGKSLAELETLVAQASAR